jgi:hypothetical protein
MRPGAFALQCGVILFFMGFASYAWDRSLVEGPPDGQLVPVAATLLLADCEVKRGSAAGSARSSEYGEPVVRYKYRHDGQDYQSSRYQRQRSSALGSMAQCRQQIDELRHQSIVQAWIDPAQPAFAILSKRLRDDSLSRLFMGIGAALTMLGLYRLLRLR